MSHILSVLVGVSGTLGLGWLFLQSLLNPEAHLDLIYQTGLGLFMVELASLYGAMFLDPTAVHVTEEGTPVPNQWGHRLQTLAVLLVFGGLIPLVTGNTVLLVLFIVSLVSKLLARTSTSSALTAWLIGLFFLTMIGVTFGAPLVDLLVDLPASVAAAKPAGQSGLFVDTPETLLIWGVVYYGVAAVLQLLYGLSPKARASATTRPQIIVKR